MWDPFKDTIHALGLWDEVDFAEAPREGGKICTFERNGSQLHLLGCEDKRDMEKLRGHPFNGIGIDETASFRPEDIDWLIDRIIVPRLGERRGWLALGGTPGHILAGRFYEATRDGSEIHRPYARRDEPEFANWRGWSSHAWSLADVMALPDAARWPAIVANWTAALEEKEKNKWTDDNPIWMREYLGRWATDASELVYKYRAHVDGKPWNQWDPPRDGPLGLAKLPAEYDDWNYGFGVDLGSKDPFALVVFAISPSDPTRTLYHVWEVEKPRAYAKVVAQVLLGDELSHENPRGLIGAVGWPNGIVVDVAQLGGNFLDELGNVYGVRCAPSDRKPGQKFAAIELFNGSLVDGRVKVLKGSGLERQLQTLRWKEDEFRIVREDKAQANHLCDAAIYARQVLANLLAVEIGADAAAPRTAAAHAPPEQPEPRRREPDSVIGRISPAVYYDPFK
jgi:hypothetical protein